jgi:hypothetical protein
LEDLPGKLPTHHTELPRHLESVRVESVRVESVRVESVRATAQGEITRWRELHSGS